MLHEVTHDWTTLTFRLRPALGAGGFLMGSYYYPEYGNDLCSTTAPITTKSDVAHVIAPQSLRGF